MTPDAVRPVHARRHREVDQGREGAQHRDYGLAGGSSGRSARALCSAGAMMVAPSSANRCLSLIICLTIATYLYW